VSLPDGARPVIRYLDFTIATIAGRKAEEETTTTAAPAVCAEGAAPAEGEAAPADDKAKKEG
jgi:hypothetical protein